MSELWSIWQKAMIDLGIEIVSPFQITVKNGKILHAEFLVKNFGAPNGTMIFTKCDEIFMFKDELHDLGYTASILDKPRENELYDREDFISLFCDWGWTGDPNKKPKWVNELCE